MILRFLLQAIFKIAPTFSSYQERKRAKRKISQKETVCFVIVKTRSNCEICICCDPNLEKFAMTSTLDKELQVTKQC